MPRKVSGKPRKNPFKDALYGTYTGPRGNPDEWRAAFREAMSPEEAAEILGDDSPWGILGLKHGASPDEIKRAWRAAALKYHPDRHPEDKKEWAQKEFIRCKAAYVSLGGKD